MAVFVQIISVLLNIIHIKPFFIVVVDVFGGNLGPQKAYQRNTTQPLKDISRG